MSKPFNGPTTPNLVSPATSTVAISDASGEPRRGWNLEWSVLTRDSSRTRWRRLVVSNSQASVVKVPTMALKNSWKSNTSVSAGLTTNQTGEACCQIEYGNRHHFPNQTRYCL